MVPGNTILIDEQITGRMKKGFEYFTVMHEAGHLMMHKEVYQKMAERRFYVYGIPEGSWGINSALCMRSNIGNGNKLTTSLDFREHQANTFAASMLMPPRVFIPYVQHLIDILKYIDGEFIIYERGVTDCTRGMIYEKFVRETARHFGVSEQAVKVQLKKYGLHALANEDSIYCKC
jgi:Zn-dependent peptidase ImmA (M78 family)